MVRGEEKHFDGTIDQLIEYAKNVKVSLIYFIQRIENDGLNMDYGQVLDSFTSICGQINTLMRFTRENKSQYIINRAVLPLLLSQERDEDLVKLTEGRVQIVNHEMVPDYLRTKPDLEIEENEKFLVQKANSITADAAAKQINAMEKLINHIVDIVKSNMVKSDNEISRHGHKLTASTQDTNELIAAVSNGKNLMSGIGPIQRVVPGPSDSLLGQKVVDQKQNVKAPELITNIKAAP